MEEELILSEDITIEEPEFIEVVGDCEEVINEIEEEVE